MFPSSTSLPLLLPPPFSSASSTLEFEYVEHALQGLKAKSVTLRARYVKGAFQDQHFGSNCNIFLYVGKSLILPFPH